LFICALVSLATLLLAFPVAYEVTRPGASRLRRVILGAVVLSLWLSVLVRTYTWLLLLQRSGPVNALLKATGVVDRPVELVRNQFGIFLGMTHILLPFMVLALVPTMRGIDPRLLQASWSLGASRFTTLRRVVVPLVRSGVVAGLLLTFILGLGFFVTPQILGSPADTFVSQIIAQEIVRRRDFQQAAAMSIMLTTLVAALYVTAMALASPRKKQPRRQR
jgi:ABC-type spermidine/putrescine transport system permease subunit I